MNIALALTYDDVLIVPRRSTFSSRSEASTRSALTRHIDIEMPIIPANMDSVTGADMAIAMARLGGIGLLHRFNTIEENVEEVKKVKRAQNYIVHEPYTILPDQTVAEARAYIEEVGVTGLLVATKEKTLLGVLSRRDFLFATDDSLLISDIMTPREKLVVGKDGTTFEEARALFAAHKVEKLPLVDEEDIIVGLITSDDIKHTIEYPDATRDSQGQLRVGGSVGVHGDFVERAVALVAAGVDVLVIDIAHGHSDLMFSAIARLREAVPSVDLIAGNVATAQAAKDLCDVGIDAIKVGVGPGSHCTTRIVTGCGMPQLTAVMEVAKIAKVYGIPVIADGGIKSSGDIVKAMGAGADTVMLGNMFAGTTESPGIVMTKGTQKFKISRGSASFTQAKRRQEKGQEGKNLSEVVPEGVESIVPFKGPAKDVIHQLIGGLKSGMSYTNSHTIKELQQNVTFVRMTTAGSTESGPHDISQLT